MSEQATICGNFLLLLVDYYIKREEKGYYNYFNCLLFPLSIEGGLSNWPDAVRYRRGKDWIESRFVSSLTLSVFNGIKVTKPSEVSMYTFKSNKFSESFSFWVSFIFSSVCNNLIVCVFVTIN